MKTFEKTTLAIAVAAAMASGASWATCDPGNGAKCPDTHSENIYIHVDADVQGRYMPTHEADFDSNTHVNLTDVQMSKKLFVTKELLIDGNVNITGSIDVDSAAMAVIDNKQHQYANRARNSLLKNTAEGGENVLEGATGNVGLNLFAGDNNMQDNAAAIASTGGQSAGMIDAEVFVQQQLDGSMYRGADAPAQDNVLQQHDFFPYASTVNLGVKNNASLGDSAMANASGNLGVNVTAGNSNLQKNSMAVSVGPGVIGEATVNSQQESRHNWIVNGSAESGGSVTPGQVSGHLEMIEVTLTADPAQFPGTGIVGTRFDRSNGSYGCSGSGPRCAEQGTFSGFIPNPGGTPDELLVNEAEYGGHHDGDLRAEGDGPVRLNGSITGEVPVWVLDSCGGGTCEHTTVQTENNARLSQSALAGASGNIGVNISAGTGNLQANSMALASTALPASGGTVPQQP